MERRSSRQTVIEIRTPMLECTTPPGDRTTGRSDLVYIENLSANVSGRQTQSHPQRGNKMQ